MIYLFIAILIAFIAQMQVLPILGLKLDLLLFATIYYGFLYGQGFGAGIGLVAGLLQDVFSFGILGLSPVGLVTCGLLAGYTRRMLLLRYWIVRVGLVFVFTVLNLIIYLVMTKIFSQTQLFLLFRAKWLMIGFGNTIMAGIVFWLVDRYG